MTPKQRTNLLRQIAVVVAVVATITVGILANVLPFNDLTTGELAAQFDVLFKPAPYAFSIWTLIYVALAAYAIYQVRPAVRDDQRLRSIDVPFLISSAANISWLLLWHHQYTVASFVVMLVLLGSLIAIYRRLAPERTLASPGRRWAVHYGFSVYLGWVIVATVANLAVLADFLGLGGFGLGELVWFTLASLGLLGVGALMTWRQADVPLLLTLVWAFIGLGVALQPMHASAAIVAWVAAAALGVLVAIAVVRQSPEGIARRGVARDRRRLAEDSC